MKQTFLLVLFFILSAASVQAQKECCFAQPLVSAYYFPLTIGDTQGGGQFADPVSCSCLTGEGGSTWFNFSTVGNGSFEMIIEPKAPGSNFDFAIWESVCPCTLPPNSPFPTTTPVACNSTVGTGPTGIATDPTASWGVPANPEFSQTINLPGGRNYFLLVTNVDDNADGFTIRVGGTGVIAPFIPPQNNNVLFGPDEVCKGGSGFFSLDSPILGADNYAWTTKHLGIPIGIPQNGPMPSMNISFPYDLQPQTFEVCVQASGPQLGCYPPAEKCKTVTIKELPVPAAFESGYVCTGDYYIAGNGEVFYFGGTFDLVYNTYQGCDSIVRLNLEQKISDFKVVVKEVCKGDCVEWNGETVCETGTYDEVLTNQWGCDSTNQLLLISVPIETKVNGADTLDCITTSINLTSAGSVFAANPIYTWRRGNTVVGNGPNLTVTVGGTYTLQIKSTVAGNTCTDEASVTIVQNTTPPQGVVATGGNINCNTSSVTLTGVSTTTGVSYSWAGPNGFSSTAQNPTVTTPGNYVLTVKGTNGCTKTATAVVTEDKVQPTAIAVANGSLNCNSNSVLLNGAGSSSGNQFSYLWTTANGNITQDANTLTPTVDAAGNYLLTVTNTANGCTNTASATVQDFPDVSLQVASQDDVACFGEANGAATVNATGGNGNYTYIWSNGANTATASGLVAGNYILVVTDGNGCTANQSVSIDQPDNLVVNAASTAQTQFGVDNGTASCDPTGGTSPYTYLWSNGETTQNLTDLAPANYTVIITDANGCTASQTVSVAANNCVVKANIDQTNVSCPGAADGTATINLDSATPPFVYAWSNGDTTQTISGLAGGTYDVSATDANGCQVVATAFVEEAANINPNAITTSLTGINSNDGTASALPTGGTPPYTYLWSNGETTESIANLPIGNYTVVVTDTLGCTASQTVTVNQFNCGLTTNLIVTNASCNGTADGQATINIQGGNAPFTFLWSNGETTATISGLAPGTYIATTTDNGGCPALAEATVTEPAALDLALVLEDEATCGVADGALTIGGLGGTAPYTYVWQSGETTETLSDIPAGTYSIAVTDANNCNDSFDVVLGTDDDVPPTAVAQDVTVSLDTDGQATVLPSAIDGGSTDDCLITAISLDNGSFDCSDIGPNTVTLLVTDAGGNTTPALAVVTVVDDAAPVLNLQAATIALGANGTVGLNLADFDLGSTDNCGIAEWTLSQSSFDCSELGVHPIEVTATDASGNATTQTIEVTVVDNTPPSITCPSNIAVPYCDPIAEFDVTAVDNCSNLVLTQTGGPASGSNFPEGTTTVSFSATDAGGNSVTCSFTVESPVEVALDLDQEDASCFGENDGSASVSATGGDSPYTYAWSTGASTPGVTGLVAGNYTVTVTDASGCTTIQPVSIGQPALLATALVTVNNATNGQQNGSIDVTVSGGVAPYTFVWTNAAGATLGDTEDISGLGAGTYTLTATDANGCVSQSGYTIQNTNGTSDSELGSLLIYPNPTSNLVTLELVAWTGLEDMEVAAIDVNGRTVLNRRATSTKLALDFSEQAAGVYILKIKIGENLLTRRLVVSK